MYKRTTTTFSTLGFRVRRKLHDVWTKATVRDFAYKVRQRMQFDRNPVFITLQDKHAVKAYAQARQVKTAEVFFVTDDPTTIPFDKLPDTCFIKANHGWNWNILRRDGAFFLFEDGRDVLGSDGSVSHAAAIKREISQEACTALCCTWLQTRHNSAEWVYQEITPKIIVEEVLEATEPGEMPDYRLFTFGGVVKAIDFDTPSHRKDELSCYFDTSWREIPLTPGERPARLPPRPDNLSEMLAIAERLGAGLDFVRVDLYNTTKGIYLGEMTLYPDSGNIDTPTKSRGFNTWLGNQWELDKRHFVAAKRRVQKMV